MSVTENTAVGGEDQSEPAAHVTGAHLLDLAGKPRSTRLRALFGEDVADIITGWHTINLGHGRGMLDYDGKPTSDPFVEELLAIPLTGTIAEAITADLGVTLPTRAQCRMWAKADLESGGDGTDPEVELDRMRMTADPDVYAAANGSERRICGVPESVYNALEPDEQAKVQAGVVIAAPQAPTFVARFLLRHTYTVRLKVPGTRRRAWMPVIVRTGQTWYAYERPAKGEAPRWVVHDDPEWMRAKLREELARFWYVKTHRANGQDVYSLKAWNPDTRTLGMVEDALADLVNIDSGTHAREIADIWDRTHRAYPASGTWVACRNGVVDVTTGTLRPETPLWFSLSRIAADYDHSADPQDAVTWLKVLESQWDGDPGAIDCLQEWFGYVISGRLDLQKWMLIVGPSGSGKSIIAEVLSALMGVVVATKLDALNSRFGLAGMYTTGAQLAVLGDIRFSTRDSSTAVENLLKITGQDAVTVERKYKSEVSARLGVRFHGSANELPRWADDSAALQKRALLLETTVGFRGTAAEDPGLKDRILSEELGFVLRWAVEGLARLNASGGRFSQSLRAAELADELAETASPTLVFVRECCELGDDDFVPEDALFYVWRKWAEENNTGKSKGKASFKRALKALPDMNIRPGQRRLEGRVVYGITRAATTYMDRDRFGHEFPKTASTDDFADTATGAGQRTVPERRNTVPFGRR